MTGRTHRIALAALVAGLAATGCGDDDTGEPISESSAQNLTSQLDQFQEALNAGECDSVAERIQDLRSDVSTLDDEGVGADVQEALDEGIVRLGALAAEACGAEDEVETTPTVPPPTETTPPPTETAPEPAPEPEPDPEPEPEPLPEEPDEGDGGGQFEPDDGGAGPDGSGAPGQLKQGDG